MMYGVDISHHQSKTAVEEIGAKVDFIITRSSVGTLKEDSKLHIFLPQIQMDNIPHGHYCASYSKNVKEAIEEADFICDVIEKYKDKPNLPVFYDWEYFSYDYVKNKFGIVADANLVREMALAFCERVNERGYKSGVYLNHDFWNRFYGDKFFEDNKNLYIWYARPGVDKPDEFCHIWQYRTGNGQDFGYKGNIDKNKMMVDIIFRGNTQKEDIPPKQNTETENNNNSPNENIQNTPHKNDSSDKNLYSPESDNSLKGNTKADGDTQDRPQKSEGNENTHKNENISEPNLLEMFFRAILKLLKGE